MGKLLFEVDHRRQLISDSMDEWACHLYVRADSKIVGTLRLNIGNVSNFPPELRECFRLDTFQGFPSSRFPDHKVSVTSKTMVAPEYRRSQAFYLLASRLYDTVRAQGGQFNFAGGASLMVSLYEQLGWRRYKSNFSVPDYGYMVPMVLVTEDIDHLRKVHSPLLRVARKLDNSPTAGEWFGREFPHVSRYINKQLISKEDFWDILAVKLGRPIERSVSLFKGLTEAEAKVCADSGHIILCEAGDTIVHPADVCNDIFVVLSGVVAARRQQPTGRPSVTILRSGQYFGEKAFITHARQNATVIAQTDTEILVFPRHGLERLQLQHPAVAAKFLRNLGVRASRKYA